MKERERGGGDKRYIERKRVTNETVRARECARFRARVLAREF